MRSNQTLKAITLGSLVADAACQPAHWIYDVEKLHDLLGHKVDAPEFCSPSINPFYTLKSGALSTYGDQQLVLLKSIAENNCKFDECCYARTVYTFYKDNGTGGYGKFSITSTPRNELPQLLPWRNSSIKHFISKINSHFESNSSFNNDINLLSSSKLLYNGFDDAQGDNYAKVSPLVVHALSLPTRVEPESDTLKQLVALVRASCITQANELSIACAIVSAILLFKLSYSNTKETFYSTITSTLAMILSSESLCSTHVQQVVTALQAITKQDIIATPNNEIVQQLGLGCGVPFSLQNAVHCILHVEATSSAAISEEDFFKKVVRINLLSGGDNCSRACIIGALVGAKLSLKAIPKSWISRLSSAKEIEHLLDVLVANNM